jgi:hypothetical protein
MNPRRFTSKSGRVKRHYSSRIHGENAGGQGYAVAELIEGEFCEFDGFFSG